MCWLKRGIWKAAIALAGTLFLMFLVWAPMSAVGAQERASGLDRPVTGTVQATPIVDVTATITALNEKKLQGDIDQQQHTFGNWFWNNGAAIISSLVLAIAGVFTLFRYLRDQRNEREKQREDRQNELEKRAEERFQKAVEGLGSEREEVKVGAAITLRTFLRPGYEQFYIQIFDLVIAHLYLPSTAQPPADSDEPLPLTAIRLALIVIFKEAFPLARGQNIGPPQSLDAIGIQLDNAYLVGADLKQVWMSKASLRKAFLNRADLSGARLRESDLRGTNFHRSILHNVDFSNTNLSQANLRDADLGQSNIENAFTLHDADLHGAKGLTKKQLEACKAKGAIIDEDVALSPPQAPGSPSLTSQSNNRQGQSAPPAQVSTPTPDTGGSSPALP